LLRSSLTLHGSARSEGIDDELEWLLRTTCVDNDQRSIAARHAEIALLNREPFNLVQLTFPRPDHRQPMAEFLTTAGISNRLEQLVSGSRTQLTLISPYVQIHPILLERLREANARGVTITLVCRDESLTSTERSQLQSLDGVRLKYMPNLHAKCYQSEAGILIASMNLYHYSERTNREMGIYLVAGEPAHEAAAAEVNSIVVSSRDSESPRTNASAEKPVSPSVNSRTPPDRAPDSKKTRQPPSGRGYCLRCQRSIPFHVERPFCIDCYQVWAEFENAEYTEAYCHDCGKEKEASVSRPLCRSCWEKNGKSSR
jgi:hypothetical protein